MKSLWRIALGLVVIGVVVAPATMAGITSEVFRVTTTLQGVIQNGPVSNSTIEKVKIQSEDPSISPRAAHWERPCRNTKSSPSPITASSICG